MKVLKKPLDDILKVLNAIIAKLQEIPGALSKIKFPGFSVFTDMFKDIGKSGYIFISVRIHHAMQTSRTWTRSFLL